MSESSVYDHDATGNRLTSSQCNALAWGGMLFCFFAAAKIYLVVWYWRGGVQPIPDELRFRSPFLLWQDAAFAAALAIAYGWIHSIASRLGRYLGQIVTCCAGLLHLALVLLDSTSVRVQQLYGQPLEPRMVNWMRDLGALRDSITASVDAPFVGMVLGGSLCFPIAIWVLAPLLRRTGQRALALEAGAVLAVLFIVAGAVQVRSVEISHGLRQNAVLFFLRNPDPEPSAADYRVEMEAARISGELDGNLDPDMRSVLHPDEREPGAFDGESAQGKNLLFLLLESTPAVVLDEAATPNLLALRRRSISLGRHYSTAPNTFDAHYSIFYSQLARGTAIKYRQLYAGLPLDRSLLDAAREAGLRTALFRSSYMDFFDMRWLYEGSLDTQVGAEVMLAGLRPGSSWGAPEELTVSKALEWLAANRKHPFLAIYNPVSPHHPYTSPDNTFSGSGGRIRYRNSLHYVDAQVGRLLKGLRDLGLENETVVIALADHGEEIGVGHGFHLNLAEIDVPAMIALPGRPARTIESETSHLDIAPTLAALVGLKQDPHWLGRDLTKATVERRVAIFGSVFGERTVVLDGDRALALEPDRGGERVLAVTRDRFEAASPEALSPEARRRLSGLIQSYDRGIRLRHFKNVLSVKRQEN